MYNFKHIDNIPLNDDKVWDLICSGNVQGIFQLDKAIKGYVKPAQPRSIKELSDLIAIIRPGPLESKIDGVSVADHYIKRKQGSEPSIAYHKELEPILKDTYQLLVYQEQALTIAKEIAGFTLIEADLLRKGIGKKLPEVIAKLKIKFIEGCLRVGKVNKKEAEEIFGWIEKSQRYSFNLSHSYSYAMNSYMTAYLKTYHPKQFMTSYLYYAFSCMDKFKEISRLINNAREMAIDVVVPDLRIANRKFDLREDIIHYGITDIKGIGDSAFDKLKLALETFNIETMSWAEALFHLIRTDEERPKVSKTTLEALIMTGGLDWLRVNRNQMLYEYEIISQLKDREIIWCRKNFKNSVKETLQGLIQVPTGRNHGGCSSTRRLATVESYVKRLEKPTRSLEDSPKEIVAWEGEFLGIAISCTATTAYDIHNTNCSCMEFKQGKICKQYVLGGQIHDVNIVKIKNGKSRGSNMAIMQIADDSGMLDNVIVFTAALDKFRELLDEGNMVTLAGRRDKRKGSFVVDKVWLVK